MMQHAEADQTMPDEERRKTQRVPFESEVHFAEYDGSRIPRKTKRWAGHGSNMSLGGMCFTTVQRPQGESLVVSFVAGTSTVLASVKVVSVQAIDVAGEEQFAVHCEFVKWLSPL